MNFNITIRRTDDPKQTSTFTVSGTLYDALLKLRATVATVVHTYGRHGHVVIKEEDDEMLSTLVLGWERENGFTPFLTIKLEDV